jgi:hypothetical protein
MTKHKKKSLSPVSEGYHPKIDNSPPCTEDSTAKYRSIIGCCIWIIVLGRFDNAYATSAMSRFNMLPREEHLKSVKSILSYLYAFSKGGLSLSLHTLTIPCTLLKILHIG